MMYAAFLVIFAKPENEIIANLTGLLLVGAFVFYQILYTSKTFYLNSMLVGYFIFYLYCILSLTWTIDTAYSFYTTNRMAMIFVNLVLLYNVLKIFKVHESIFAGFMLGMYVNTLLALEVLMISSPVYLKVRFIGTTTHPNTIGLLALFGILGSILLLQNAKNRAWIAINIVNILGSLYVIILTASRSSLLIAGAIIFLYLFQLFLNPKSRYYLIFFGALGVVVFLSVVDMEKLAEHVGFAIERIAGIFGTLQGQHADGSTAERLSFLHTMMGVFKENPFFGTGLNTSRVFLHGFYSHNNYVEILGTLGLVGFFIYYSAYAYMLWKISLVKEFWTKYYLFIFAAVIIIYDFAGVTFYAKDVLLMLLVLHYMAEEEAKGV